jgi:chemotaxis protein methyltransferase CheR
LTLLTAPNEQAHLSEHDFQGICRLVRNSCGIHLGADKRSLIEARLTRRVRARNLDSFHAYCKYLFRSADEEELTSFINCITTNKTDFFREPRHFELLTRIAIPGLKHLRRPFLLWSAACSSGEEPYTIAMVLSEYQQTHPGFSFRIFASDISTDALEQAVRAIYTTEVIEPVPMHLRRKYLLKSRDRHRGHVRITPELRSLVSFERLNFIDDDYGLDEKAHVIFCRNALIYFDRPTQKKIVGKLLHHLVPGGYLFIGHSENLNAMKLPLERTAPAMYQKRE